MWITISKIGAYLASPLSLVLLLIAIGLILTLFVSRRGGICVVFAAALLLTLASSPPVANRLVMALEEKYPVSPLEQYEPVETLVILGGSINMPQGKRIYTELMEGSDRVLHGFRLFKAARASRILLSGGNIDRVAWKQSEASLVARLLMEWGVPENLIDIEGDSQTTYENALNTAAFLQRNGIGDGPVLLVTSAIHMPRSVAVFRAAGVNVIPAPTDITVLDTRYDGLFGWLPSIGALGATSRAVHEYIGLCVYWIRGWL